MISRTKKSIETEDLSFTSVENWIFPEIIYSDSSINFCLSSYKGYPIEHWETENIFLVFEGLIYNQTESSLKVRINQIAADLEVEKDVPKSLESFIEDSDGDFIISIWDKKRKRFFLFNDYLGRIPIYYYADSNQVIVSRGLKFILEYIPEIQFDKSGMVENLSLGYSLGSKTIFKNIKRLFSSNLIRIDLKDHIRLEILQTSNFNFTLKDPFRNKSSSLSTLNSILEESTKNRINKLSELQYNLVADLSGGFDTRILIGSLRKWCSDITYITYEYTQDESEIARDLFQKLGNPGQYQKMEFDNVVDLLKINDLVYKTDGLTSYVTTAICYNDIKFVKKKNDDNIAHFGGLAGEFIRHPWQRYYRSVLIGYIKGFYSSIKPEDACAILKKDFSEYQNELSEYFEHKYGKSKDATLKEFYFEYYRNYVGYAGEERNRGFFWSVQPIWNKEFLRTFFHRIPVKWIGYKYFVEFMKLLDTKLLEVPIYKSKVNLRSRNSVNKLEGEYLQQFNLQFRLFNFVADKFPFLISFYRKFKKRHDVSNNRNRDEINNLLKKYYNELTANKSIFDLHEAIKHLPNCGGENNRLITLIMYVQEIQKRYPDKTIDSDSI